MLYCDWGRHRTPSFRQVLASTPQTKGSCCRQLQGTGHLVRGYVPTAVQLVHNDPREYPFLRLPLVIRVGAGVFPISGGWCW